MSSSPLVTIVTPSYNTGRFVGDAVESVLTQAYRNIEYLVMDGGSTDNTLSELRRFGERIKWVSERDRGQSDALNKGFLKAKGQIFGWLNSDDTYAPNAVAEAVNFLWSHPDVAAVYGDAMFIDAEGKDIAKCVHVEPFDKHRFLHYTDFIVQPACFFRRSAFEAVGGVDTSLHWCMDYDLWLKMINKGLKIEYLPKHLANFRWLADNKTATGDWGRLREIEKVVARYADGTHGYIRLEMVNLHLQEAKKKLKRFRLFGTTSSLVKATATYVSSARAIRSTFQPKTWKIVWTGQVLRKRALAEQKAKDKVEMAKAAFDAKNKPAKTPGKGPGPNPALKTIGAPKPVAPQKPAAKS
jgi:glycosyltransferase involved in cell wall biosynthesis